MSIVQSGLPPPPERAASHCANFVVFPDSKRANVLSEGRGAGSPLWFLHVAADSV